MFKLTKLIIARTEPLQQKGAALGMSVLYYIVTFS